MSISDVCSVLKMSCKHVVTCIAIVIMMKILNNAAWLLSQNVASVVLNNVG